MGQPDSYTPPPSKTGLGRVMRPELPPDYRPTDDEEFMNPYQIEYFRQKLLRWRADLLRVLIAQVPDGIERLISGATEQQRGGSCARA